MVSIVTRRPTRKLERHGMSQTIVYRMWKGMLARCYNPTVKNYNNYGGRGITVCERWHYFTHFYADMGDRPTPQHSIGRIDNDGPYSLENCRWEMNAAQQSNKRNSHLITAFGETHTLAEWCRITKISRNAVNGRLQRGWPIEMTLSKPLVHSYPRKHCFGTRP